MKHSALRDRWSEYLSHRSTIKLSRTFIFPLTLIVVFTVLVGLNVSGSSIAVYETNTVGTDHTGESIFGQVRPIRSDEWLVRTPWLISQVQTNFETTRTSGMGMHDVGIVGDLPTRDLDLIVKPHHIPLLFVGPDRAISSEWWTWHLLMACGVYALLTTLTRKKMISVVIAFLLLSSPSTQWWAAPGTFTTVGYGCLAAAIFIKSLDAVKTLRRGLLASLAGWLFACFVATLYIPWVITTTIIVGFIVIAVLIDAISSSTTLRRGLRKIWMPTSITGVTALAFIALYFLRHHDAIAIISRTVYPGERATETGGGISAPTVFGAPFDYFASQPQTAQVNGTNQSENSSGTFYFLPVLISSIWLFYRKNAFTSKKDRNVLIGILLAGLIFTAWLLLPVKSSVGQLLLLDRVRPIRILPAMTLVSLIALGLLLANFVSSSVAMPRKIVLCAVTFFAVIHLYALDRYSISGRTLEITQGLPVVLYLCFVLYVLLRKQLVYGSILILLYGVFQFVQVNPIQQGASPLIDNPMARLISKITQENPDLSTWFFFGGDPYVRGTLEASPINFLSGVSRYPDYNFWEVLDPKRNAENAWNRYGHIYVSAGALNSEPQIVSNSPDTIQLTLDPCDARLVALAVDAIVTQDFEIGCHELIGTTFWGESLIRVYRN